MSQKVGCENVKKNMFFLKKTWKNGSHFLTTFWPKMGQKMAKNGIFLTANSWLNPINGFELFWRPLFEPKMGQKWVTFLTQKMVLFWPFFDPLWDTYLGVSDTKSLIWLLKWNQIPPKSGSQKWNKSAQKHQILGDTWFWPKSGTGAGFSGFRWCAFNITEDPYRNKVCTFVHKKCTKKRGSKMGHFLGVFKGRWTPTFRVILTLKYYFYRSKWVSKRAQNDPFWATFGPLFDPF